VAASVGEERAMSSAREHGILCAMSVFGLVHGAWHGAWTWEQLTPELEIRGHQAVAVDLPITDDDAGLDAYAETIVAALADAQEDVVLVAHSLAGLTVPLVAAARPLARVVLIAALLPQPGLSLVDELRSGREILIGRNEGRVIRETKQIEWVEPQAAIDTLYTDVEPQLAAACFARLRPQANKPHVDKAVAGWPDVPTEYVVCAQDRMVSPDYQRAAPFTRRVLASAHSPMLSEPSELARILCS
jgi:Alpha/beta hydrolase family